MINEKDIIDLMDRVNNYAKFMHSALSLLSIVRVEKLDENNLYTFCEGLMRTGELLNREVLHVLSGWWKDELSKSRESQENN